MKSAAMFGLFFGLFIAGAAGAAAGTAGASDDAADATLCASYQVPLDPAGNPALVSFSSFPITGLAHSVVDGRAVIQYPLPLELTGKAQVVSFTGAAGQGDAGSFTGPNGTMVCAGDVCQVKFHDLAIDQDQVLVQLKGISRNDAEFGLRSTVARTFASDPGGVLTYGPCGR